MTHEIDETDDVRQQCELSVSADCLSLSGDDSKVAIHLLRGDSVGGPVERATVLDPEGEPPRCGFPDVRAG